MFVHHVDKQWYLKRRNCNVTCDRFYFNMKMFLTNDILTDLDCFLILSTAIEVPEAAFRVTSSSPVDRPYVGKHKHNTSLLI